MFRHAFHLVFLCNIFITLSNFISLAQCTKLRVLFTTMKFQIHLFQTCL